MTLSPTLVAIADHDTIMRVDYIQAFYRLCEVCRESGFEFKLPAFLFETRNL